MSSPLPPTTTPEALLKHIETCIAFYCDDNFEDERAERDAALTFLRALAALPPQAPLYNGHIDADCEVYRGVGACCTCETPDEKAERAREQAEIERERDAQPVASPALDHEALVTRLTALADAFHESADVLRALTAHTTLAYTRDEVLGYQVNAANLMREAAVALRAAPSAPAVPQPQWECADCGEKFIEHPLAHNHHYHDGSLSAGIRSGFIRRIAPPSSTSGAPR